MEGHVGPYRARFSTLEVFLPREFFLFILQRVIDEEASSLLHVNDAL